MPTKKSRPAKANVSVADERELQIEMADAARDLQTLERARAANALPRMMTANEILDLAVSNVARENGIAPEDMTDYRFGKITGFKQQTISSWRRGKTFIAREYAATFARLAGLSEEYVYACLEHDRHSDPTVKRILREIAHEFWNRTAASILLGVAAMLAHIDDSRAAGKLVVEALDSPTAPAPATARSLYIMVNRMRRFLRRFRPVPTSQIPARLAWA